MTGNKQSIDKWDRFELSLKGPSAGNPFTDVQFGASFKFKNRTVEVDGFHDGNGVYKIRFMPDTLGRWSYLTRSNKTELNGISGDFACVKPSSDNHGPVRVFKGFHFAYADGTRYYPIGTTCYAWTHQTNSLERQTLRTLARAPFNKMRMCVFPKHYGYNANEPRYYPFEQRKPAVKGKWHWDLTRFNPAFFQHFEHRVGDLLKLGIEADIILFHPYDRWGFATMDAATDDRYLRYIVARLAAYRNVWWSMANEWDLMKAKSEIDFDRFFRIVQESDPYQHLRSNHNCHLFYDHAKPWVTHASVQNSNMERIQGWRNSYRKPVVVDECCYEGNIQQGWGNIPAWEMVNRFWEGTIQGGYVGHGETYLHPRDILWWSKGGELHGQSPRRIAFLRNILEEAPLDALIPATLGRGNKCLAKEGEYYLCYYNLHQPGRMPFELPVKACYRIDIIDTWNMTIKRLNRTFKGNFFLDLPGKPFVAVRIQKAR